MSIEREFIENKQLSVRRLSQITTNG